MNSEPAIAVVGLGYVGLPLAVALARHYPTLGFDISRGRIAEIRAGRDRTGEVADDVLAASTLEVTDDSARMAGRNLFIVTVPTPVDDHNEPDLTAVLAACDTIGRHLVTGAVVVFESTVYPGVTEDLCGPALERASGLMCGRDFHLGYSPERINPGDRVHTVDRIAKVVAGDTPEVAALLERVYGRVTTGGIHVAPNIKTAEAAKAIENAQRDINIAFINEVAVIADRLGISVYDVLAAAGTKWNFLPFTPGLVGGHCIGVDPYYLAWCARQLGHEPEIILAGRRLNDSMADRIARRVDGLLGGPARILVMGLTFKENVPDLRNSKSVDLVRALAGFGHRVEVHDPVADAGEAAEHYRLELAGDLAALSGYDAVVGAVGHAAYKALDGAGLARLLRPGGLVADFKAIWRDVALPAGYRRWQL